MQAGIARRQHTTPLDGGEGERIPLPIGDAASRSLDHRDEGEKVVWTQPGLYHQIDEPAGQQPVGMAVAAPAVDAGLRTERFEATALVSLEHFRRRGVEHRAAELRAAAGMH